jgi:metal-responsive CopG/Arc/MetJ family transcriptional regulator
MDNKKQYMTLMIPQRLAIQARVVASRQNMSRSKLVRLAIVEYLKRLEQAESKTEPSDEPTREA